MTDAQVVIIGGGVMGVSLLFHLTEAGWKDVVLVEKNNLTHGSTWHAAGLCTHFAHDPTIQELRARSVRLYRDELPNRTGESCGFHRSGAMRITRNPDRMDEFRHVAGLSRFTGYELEVLSVERITQLHPLAKTDGLIGGIYEPDDGHVDPSLATNAMATLAVKNGAVIRRYDPVHEIKKHKDHWLVYTENAQIKTQHVVNAAGTWCWEVGRMMELNLPVVPVLHQYLVTESVPVISQRIANGDTELPIIRDPEESWYVRQERDGLILGPYESDAKIWSPDGVPAEFGAELLPADLDRVEPIVNAALQRIPSLGHAGIKTVVNGPITFTPDANPLIGPADGLQNAWLLTGSSMGVMEGGGAGWFLAQWMTNGAPPMNALSVDSRRFGPWADRDYRVDKAIECFGLQFGVHYPFEERPAGRNKRQSPLHDALLQQGAVMGSVNGWERPNWFSASGDDSPLTFNKPGWFNAVADEVRVLTQSASLADLSVLSKFKITGTQTREYVDTLGANKAPATGRIGLIHALNTTGGVQSEFTVAMWSEEEAYLTSASGAERIDYAVLQSHAAKFDVVVENVTAQIACIGIMGPLSRTILAELTDSGLTGTNMKDGFAWLHAKQILVADISVMAMRMSYVGELGWELHVRNDKAMALFNSLQSAGKKHGMGYYGAYTANSMRLEKGYVAWGSELTTERTPEESDAGAFVKTDNRKFTGREALIARRGDTAWRTVLLEVENDDVYPFYSHPVYQKDRVVGIVTSAAYGHRCNKNLAFALLRDHKSIDHLSVEILGVRYTAKHLSVAPQDPDNSRLHS